ncbi:tRNA-specific adenosine deaminase 1 isoform X2 [Melanotaenia boesemani]|uniref:tRNA-specific adenosine deaminase 1 isoform X2 n=1 Tax=Melanotaenia boesemani TaxID=1250792 RepID=UPI001C053265|nr:tRNA-specific adenosine deaminase 1 isoform X2 [Melanotaenia boesemani]
MVFPDFPVKMINADQIAELCYERFSQLPRRGKPDPGREWTLLAAVVQVTRSEMEVVSMGTGTKCIGRAAMSPAGDVLNDSHAEVIARRGCIRYLIHEMSRAVSGRGSAVFCPSDQRCKFRLHPGVSFLFFTSHTPCGDASIIPMSDSQSQPCPPLTSGNRRGQTDAGRARKRVAEDPREGRNSKLPHLEEEKTSDLKQEDRKQPESQTEVKPRSLDQTDGVGERPQVLDIHRTGARCVPGGPADPLQPGEGYHSTGLLRVKPGRGEPTLSLSCSDKLARWGVVGFQGALLSHYLEEALYFSTVVVGKCPFSQDVLHRALVARCSHVSNLPAGFSVCPPVLLQSSLEFPFSQNQTQLQHQVGQGRISPCGAAISWCNVTEQPLDVTANGYKQGVTRKALGSPQARSLLCKLELFHSFLSLVSTTDPSALPQSLRTPELHTYWDYKQASQSYQQAWQQLHSQAFPLWPRSNRNLLLFH